MVTALDHLVITTADMPACIAFYQALGFTARDAGNRWELFAGDFKINLHYLGRELEPKAAHVGTGSADLCFVTGEPLAACKARLVALGYPLVLDIGVKSGARGPMESFYLRDPDENLVELCSYAGQ